MNIDSLVELIAKRVTEQLLAAQQETVVVKSESVLVVGKCEDRSRLQETLGNTFTLSFAEDLESPAPADFDHIVLAQLPNPLLSALVAGIERGADSCVIIESLLLGKTVYALEEGVAYRRYKATAKPALYQVFEQKEETLNAYGVEVVGLGDLAARMNGQEVAAIIEAPEKTEAAHERISEVVYNVGAPGRKARKQSVKRLEKRVVGEKDLRLVYEQGIREIALAERALLTPLAKDFVKMNEDLKLVEHS